MSQYGFRLLFAEETSLVHEDLYSTAYQRDMFANISLLNRLPFSF